MRTPNPLYNATNCQPSYKLYWTLSVFWRDRSLRETLWLDNLKSLTENQGVRILEYRQKDDSVSQFLLSTRPHLSPSDIIRFVKGPMQALIRDQAPKAFKHNYSMTSVGESNHKIVQEYLKSQLTHHRIADPGLQSILSKYQIDYPAVDLTKIQSSARGRFLQNLHLVLVNTERYHEVREEKLQTIMDTLYKVSLKKGFRLSRASVMTDHIHLTLGCNVTDSPQQVALTFLNNIAFVFGQSPLFQYSYYVGTFGEYDLGAIRQSLRQQSSLRGGKPRGGDQSFP